MKQTSLLLLLGLGLLSVIGIQAQPSIGGFNVYYGHLHNHTAVSDGTGTPAQAYSYARDVAHLDFFGLAEHANLMSSTEWTTVKSAANSLNADGIFTTFYGFEWTTFLSYGHVAVINTEDYCSTASPTNTFTGLLTWLNARNGIAFFNHPGWDVLAFQEFNHFSNPPSEKFVGMELWNDHDGFNKYYYNDGFYSNDGNKGYFDEALTGGWKIGAAGSDDNHTSTWGTATDWRIGVLSNKLSRTEIMNAFLARRFFSTLDKNLSISFKINGSEMGSTIAGGTWNAIIKASDGDGEIFDQVVLVKNGSVLNSWSPWVAQPEITQNIICNKDDYFYIRVRQADGNEAISSPIFISAPSNLPPSVSITNPLDHTTFEAGDPIVISANASDADGSIQKVDFYQGSTLLGSASSEPYSINWNNAIAGTYLLTAVATDNLGLTATSPSITVTVNSLSAPIIFSKQIFSGNDDVEESSKGTVSLSGDDIELCYDTKSTGSQIVGLRFNSIAIPQGATITKAYIQFTANEASRTTCSLTIKGEDSDNSAAFNTTSKNVSRRVKTSSSVSWIPEAWTAGDIKGFAQQTPDLKLIVQEIVDRSGWISGNSLAFIVTGSGTGKRTAVAYETNASNAAILYVEFTLLKSGKILTTKPDLIGSNEISKMENELLCYPIPFTDVINVQLQPAKNDKLISIGIFNSSGNLLKYFLIAGVKTQIDLAELPSGIYFIKCTSTSKIYIQKIIKN
jgi:predicted metal-dependent phosphoesterase TrpH